MNKEALETLDCISDLYLVAVGILLSIILFVFLITGVEQYLKYMVTFGIITVPIGIITATVFHRDDECECGGGCAIKKTPFLKNLWMYVMLVFLGYLIMFSGSVLLYGVCKLFMWSIS